VSILEKIKEAGAGLDSAIKQFAEESRPFVHELLYLEKMPEPLTTQEFLAITQRRKAHESWKSIADSYSYLPSTMKRLYSEFQAGVQAVTSPEESEVEA